MDYWVNKKVKLSDIFLKIDLLQSFKPIHNIIIDYMEVNIREMFNDFENLSEQLQIKIVIAYLNSYMDFSEYGFMDYLYMIFEDPKFKINLDQKPMLEKEVIEDILFQVYDIIVRKEILDTEHKIKIEMINAGQINARRGRFNPRIFEDDYVKPSGPLNMLDLYDKIKNIILSKELLRKKLVNFFNCLKFKREVIFKVLLLVIQSFDDKNKKITSINKLREIGNNRISSLDVQKIKDNFLKKYSPDY